MFTSQATGWNTEGDKSGMVSIGTHKLFLSASGPDRKPGEPIILLMQGLGSTIAEWVAVRRLVVPFARWVQYDRSGLGRSEAPPHQPDAINAAAVARELETLLKNSDIEPPFIIVCHSWGGITAREFLQLRPRDVVGMVFVDANTEKTFDGAIWLLPCVTAITEGLSWPKGTGLEVDQVLSDREWAEVKKFQDDPQNQKTEAAESEGFKSDGKALATKYQIENRILGNHPISVIKSNTYRDMKRMFDAGVAAGKGTKAERAEYEEALSDFDEAWTTQQRELLKLSNRGRFIQIDDAGHNVQMLQPAVVAREIRWVWDVVQGVAA
ncbi:related to alpha/beta hydrolase [Phialocephala subalpina]|uniref:Related to alpha/beta hydrolase n=1 Tax=Phialocephala subalpina TaxID=576137 RepID=A0A1L7XMN3_9HELO|nr:related to alpha/beta hydrolase [Phialocephala subalpina]